MQRSLNLDKEADEYEQAEDDVIGDDDVGEAKLLVLGRLLCKSLQYTIIHLFIICTKKPFQSLRKYPKCCFL